MVRDKGNPLADYRRAEKRPHYTTDANRRHGFKTEGVTVKWEGERTGCRSRQHRESGTPGNQGNRESPIHPWAPTGNDRLSSASRQ